MEGGDASTNFGMSLNVVDDDNSELEAALGLNGFEMAGSGGGARRDPTRGTQSAGRVRPAANAATTATRRHGESGSYRMDRDSR